MQMLSLLFLLLALPLSHQTNSVPLSTRGRWIVNSSTGRRVKFRCVNWAGHMPAVIPEGLDRQPVEAIAARIASLGFNCVRLTWATYLWTQDAKYGELTVGESLESLGLRETSRGVRENNRQMVGLRVREAYDSVVRALGEAGVMVVLDNHVSRPQWCCGREDGNGFFGDEYFDADEWVRGLDIVARRYRRFPQVVGMSLRNELRGPNQTQPSWYLNMARGAHAIHKANPNALIIVSGMSFDTDLSFLVQHPLNNPYKNKLVLEAHWYAFSEGRRQDWADRPLPSVCSGAIRRFDERAGFVTRRGNGSLPLFVSEFGVDQRGTNRADNNFLSCFMAFAAERDLDWALWALQGSYYWRNDVEGFEETYGVLDSGWARPKNPRFKERFRLIQEMIQDPSSTLAPFQLIFHPPTGLCLSVDGQNNAMLRDCKERALWTYNEDRSLTILVENATFCLRLVEEGESVRLSGKCDDMQSSWRRRSSMGFGLIGKDGNGSELCMEGFSTNSSIDVIARKCVCLDEPTCSSDTRRQWFQIISSNVE